MKKIMSLSLAIMLLVSIIPAMPAQAATQTITYLTEAVYDSIGVYSEGYVWVKQGDTFKYLDAKGKVVIDLSNKKYVGKNEYIAEVGDFHDGLALIAVAKEATEEDFEYDPYRYYIDTKGNIALKSAQIEKKPSGSPRISPTAISGFFSPFSEGVTVTDTRPEDGNVAIIKPDGSVKWYSGSMDYYWYTQGLLCAGSYVDGELLWGYVDKTYKKVISYKYEEARPFNQNLAPVKIKGKWGFINKSGKTVIKAQFEDFGVQDKTYSYQVFNDGLATVKKNGKWGAIDKKGKTVVSFKYDNPVIFSNGLACVKGSDGKYTYIDKKGKTVIKTKYADANYFSKDGIAIVGNNGTYKLINSKGKQIGTKTWKFDGTNVSGMTPDILKYKIGNKWGIAKIG
ncbi:WG containing repeat-containing protein [Anaerocolumna jejuensis DSM 15929]|uniref:WG containing repeat-containing protein n=1 Tax=Anaerocolumna jejuensis DSM 15929 TaxID=1121322 RepID=A0A1M6KJU5_9FIRM|nr:WG repeat-containing protein [Anaerocolumna jejuensis]SHJ59120.1 WG containing repeat-containing protein [Anaerocolumna jejuensis DSM 15929]